MKRSVSRVQNGCHGLTSGSSGSAAGGSLWIMSCLSHKINWRVVKSRISITCLKRYEWTKVRRNLNI